MSESEYAKRHDNLITLGAFVFSMVCGYFHGGIIYPICTLGIVVIYTIGEIIYRKALGISLYINI